MSKTVDVSIVVPVYNEAENLPLLFQRLTDALDKEAASYEIIFTNDGSQDASFDLLKEFYQKRPDCVRIIDFHGNFGQHMAIMAAFEKARGTRVVTLDADLQNPPEEIPKLLAKMDEGFDYVGSYRHHRQDTFFRTYVSRLVNWFRESTTDIKMRDQGCMLRAYSRQIIDQIVQSGERSTFIPALAYKFSFNPTEVEVKHDARAAGVSKYNLYRLVRLNFDLITGFSLIPLQIFTLFGMVVSALSGLLVAYLVLRRLIIGPEAEGVFTLFAILFFLVSVVITGIGIMGEYLGRIFQTLSHRPRFVIRQVIEKNG
ncbi:MAG: UDP-4-amino-4-deoxy-L-arabinose-oxoglutarate aminotransferase [Alphaproteobacteria bacterium]|jgi:undecaprenyl-phosphate 4-deoxy-4-formamido-L-arabinose transferase|nr:UDP-4-amino-4-deoxy-L-arabinose-oxoglutarate aminotransferase [Alphaproteobacteria bacterium]